MSSKPMEVKKRRNADYELLSVANAWTPANPEKLEGTCGNIKYQVEGSERLIDVVSAPYALARLCALFEGLQIQVGGQEFYKVTWQTVLTHKETGHVVTFYDYKGGISFGSDISGDKTPERFIQDLKALLKALRNDRFPHPYDGCVIGEIA